MQEKLEAVQQADEGKEVRGEIEDSRHPADNTENLLSRVNNSSSLTGRNEGEGETYERNSKKGTKLHQLLDSKPRTDAVAAG